MPVTLFFIALVLATQVGMRAWYLKVTENETVTPPFYVKYAPASINATCIIIYGIIYKAVAFWLVDIENHRYTQKYENSLVAKIYMFQFINSYISCFIYAFWARKTELLSNNLITILAFKQIGFNTLEYFQYLILNGWAIRKITRVFDDKISKEQDWQKKRLLRLHKFVEEQLCMKKERDTLVFFYNEAIVQLGFICLFSPSFPLAALFSVLTNLLEIRTKLNSLSSYSRRIVSQGASGIGNWVQIMEFISMVCIPVNLALVYFTGPKGEKSSFVNFLEERGSEVWTAPNIVLLCVLIEHIILFIKIALAVAIDDVPNNVAADEYKRTQVVNEAYKKLLDVKVKGNFETYDEILSVMQKQLDEELKGKLADAKNDEMVSEDDVLREFSN